MGNGNNKSNQNDSEKTETVSNQTKTQTQSTNTEKSPEVKELEAKLEELEAKNKEKNQELEAVKTKANEVIKKLIKENKSKGKNSDDLFPGARKTKTFECGYNNGYEDGTVEEFAKKQKELDAKALVQT